MYKQMEVIVYLQGGGGREFKLKDLLWEGYVFFLLQNITFVLSSEGSLKF